MVFISAPPARGLIAAAGLEFHSVDLRGVTHETPSPRHVKRFHSVAIRQRHTERMLDVGVAAIRSANVQALVVDEADFASASIADSLGIPFITLSTSRPLFLDPVLPPIVVGWTYSERESVRRRNAAANAAVRRLLAPTLAVVNGYRSRCGLPVLGDINDIFSRRAVITQLPAALEFPGNPADLPLHYVGPLIDQAARYRVDFPWTDLSGRPFVYTSLGTIRNDQTGLFSFIAEACARVDLELVISLGGGRAEPASLGRLPGDPVVVHYAPQLELLKLASLAVTHAGLNTTLESLREGVPLVAIPITDDQPGIAARLRSVRAAEVVPLRQLSTDRLECALRQVAFREEYRTACQRLGRTLRLVDGTERAADIVQASLS